MSKENVKLSEGWTSSATEEVARDSGPDTKKLLEALMGPEIVASAEMTDYWLVTLAVVNKEGGKEWLSDYQNVISDVPPVLTVFHMDDQKRKKHILIYAHRISVEEAEMLKQYDQVLSQASQQQKN